MGKKRPEIYKKYFDCYIRSSILATSLGAFVEKMIYIFSIIMLNFNQKKFIVSN